MLLRLQKFNLDVQYKWGTETLIAEMLSRDPMCTTYTDTDLDLMHVRLYRQLDQDVFLQDLGNSWSQGMSLSGEGSVWTDTKEVIMDESLQVFLNFIQQGFPATKGKVPMAIRD